MLPHAPGVQVQAIPEDGAVIEDSEAEEKVNPEDRLPQRDLDKRMAHENEYSDSEDEGEGARRDNRSYKGSRKRPRLEKGQEAMDTDIKKEEDIKSEPKENEKDEKTNSTNEEAKKDGGANP